MKGKYIHFVKSTLVCEHNEPNHSVSKPFEPMNKENIHVIGYDVPESSTSRRNWSSKGPVLLRVTQGGKIITTTITVSLFRRDTSKTTKRVKLKQIMSQLHTMHRL